MVDLGKPITKHRQDDLEPAETIIAGTVAQPPGSFRRDKPLLLGLTEQRLLIFGEGSITQDVGRFSGMMPVNFVDDTAVQFEALKGAEPVPFVDGSHTATDR